MRRVSDIFQSIQSGFLNFRPVLPRAEILRIRVEKTGRPSYLYIYIYRSGIVAVSFFSRFTPGFFLKGSPSRTLENALI